MSLVQRIEPFITDLLHINAGTKNKLIDLAAGDAAKTYYLTRSDRISISRYILNVIADRIGKPGNTALLKSSMEPDREQRVGADVNAVEWADGTGGRDSRQLHKYVEAVYKELSLKGNNPLFLSVGALEWEVAVRGDVIKRVSTPFFLFPIRLVRTGSVNTPIYIEFIDDEIYINPCLIAKLKQALGASGEDIVSKLPHPNGEGISADIPVELARLGNGEEYFAALTAYIAARRQSEDTVFEFNKDVVAIAQYNHDELCMYYDIKRHKDKLYASPLTDRIFNQHDAFAPSPALATEPMCILDRDSVQERMISRVVNGESLVIKGPPGTGKTLTITNMLAALLAANKRVLLTSQKPAAMMEVVAKLPEPLRKFVMVLDSETEAQAAALNPNEVRKDFNALLHKASAFQRNVAMLDDFVSGMQEAKSAAKSLERYLTLMFGPMDIIGHTYYQALDVLCKIDAAPIPFAKPAEVMTITRPTYNGLLAAVTEAGGHFAKLSNGHPIIKSPWRPGYGALENVNIDAALTAYAEISTQAKRLSDVYATLSDGLGNRAGELPICLIKSILGTTLTAEQIAEAAAPMAQQAGKDTAEAYAAYLDAMEAKRDTVSILPEKRGELRRFATKTQKWTADLTIELFLAICEEWEFVSSLAAPARLPYLLRFLEATEKLDATIATLEDKLYTLVQKELCHGEVVELLREAYDKLSDYATEEKITAPRLLDFKAKKYYQQMQGLGYGDNLAFSDAVTAVCLMHEIDETRALVAREQAAFSAQIHVKITDRQVALLDRLIGAVRASDMGIGDYVAQLADIKEDVTAASALISYKLDATLGDVASLVQITVAFDNLRSCFALLLTTSQTFAYENEEGLLRNAEALTLARQLLAGGWLGKEPADIGDRIAYLRSHGAALAPLVDILFDSLDRFAEEHFKNYYTTSAMVSVNDLAILMAEATDRSIVQAANAYLTILYRENALSLERFFRPFEAGVRTQDGFTFADIFEHSVFSLAVEARLAMLGGLRYGLGDHVTGELTKREAAERRLASTVLSLVEQQCISRIKPNDPDFAFLSAERSGNETLRRFFKVHAAEILKLKQCFILSPSTVSVFLRDPKFADFDVVIVDEASQLTPTAILPMLFRTKQLVLVGDEWQMPPIKHFVARGQRAALGAEGETLYLNPDMSVLSLALNHCAFPAEKLECHYRSRTEPLITFSQARYYPYMRTFPSTTPKREGLGFKDIYLPDGYCESAQNQAEAEAVVAELNLHFDTYYKDGRLSESVGVVAFGEEQVDCIRAAVAADKELTKKIKTAIENYPDLEEKLIFFKTIETVQGQETDHLILSLTYGRNAQGKIVQSFGELNVGQASDRLGECIFNVAVTRAKISVTMIHSVRAEDITNDNIAFLADYLYTVRRFSEGGREQFVGKTVAETERGFLRQVADTLVAAGVDEDRIVVNFGATSGSVRIPIAILSEDKTRALLGVWCETAPDGDDDYYDYNLRYFRVLEGENRDWKLHRVYIQDWVDNRKATEEALCEAVRKYVLTN